MRLSSFVKVCNLSLKKKFCWLSYESIVSTATLMFFFFYTFWSMTLFSEFVEYRICKELLNIYLFAFDMFDNKKCALLLWLRIICLKSHCVLVILFNFCFLKICFPLFWFNWDRSCKDKIFIVNLFMY